VRTLRYIGSNTKWKIKIEKEENPMQDEKGLRILCVLRRKVLTVSPGFRHILLDKLHRLC